MTATAGAMRRIIITIVIAALVGSMLLIGADPGTTAPVRTKVGLRVTDKTVGPRQKILFFGKVKSPKGKCRRNRKVALFRKGTGKLKQKKTDGEGEYRFRINPRPDRGRYYVKALKKKFKRGGYGYYGYGGGNRRCRVDKSKVIKIRPRRV
jgi:hypothetical protein